MRLATEITHVIPHLQPWLRWGGAPERDAVDGINAVWQWPDQQDHVNAVVGGQVELIGDHPALILVLMVDAVV